MEESTALEVAERLMTADFDSEQSRFQRMYMCASILHTGTDDDIESGVLVDAEMLWDGPFDFWYRFGHLGQMLQDAWILAELSLDGVEPYVVEEIRDRIASLQAMERVLVRALPSVAASEQARCVARREESVAEMTRMFEHLIDVVRAREDGVEHRATGRPGAHTPVDSGGDAAHPPNAPLRKKVVRTKRAT